MKDRRTHKCNGECGRANCGYETIRAHHLKRHIRRVPRQYVLRACLHCGKLTKMMSTHIKQMHPEKYVRKIHPCPFPDDPYGWAIVKEIVQKCDSNDKQRSHKWTDEDREELLARNNNARHDIAVKMYIRWKAMGDYDDAGGYVKGGLHLRRFSLHKLSPDRIHNDRPHFIDNKLGNINFVSLGINTSCNMVSLHGKRTCAYLRRRSRKPITDTEIQTVLDRERTTHSYVDGKRFKNAVYCSCQGAWRRDGKKYFESLHVMFEYVYDLLVSQGAICAVTDFLMDEHAGSEPSAFQPSLDAINPSLGHRPGNLQWVCCFVNSTDLDKKNDVQDDTPTGWKRLIFKSYIGI